MNFDHLSRKKSLYYNRRDFQHGQSHYGLYLAFEMVFRKHSWLNIEQALEGCADVLNKMV